MTDETVTSTESEATFGSPKKPRNKFTSWLDSYFHISERGSSILRELLGGLVIFLAMFYILPLNGNMLSSDWANIAGEANTNVKMVGDVRYILLYGETWLSVDKVRAAVFAATAISAAVTTIFMGFFGKLPIGLASGLGLNSMIAFNVMLDLNYNFAQALCLVMIDGVLFLIISLTPLRAWIIRNIPKSLKFAISAGIGFFICFIGFQNMGIISNSDATLVALGNFKNPTVIVGLIGVLVVLALSSLPAEKNKVFFWINKFAVIIAIVIMALVCGTLGQCKVDGFAPFYNSSYHISEIGNFGSIFGVAFRGFDVLKNPMAYALIFSLLFLDFFDTAGTFVGVEVSIGMSDSEGKIHFNDRHAMIVDAAGTVFGSVCGTTTVTSFVESTTGVAAGAKTGLAAVSTGVLFALSLLIYPLLSAFSSSAVTGLALVYVGICMFKNLESLEWKNWIAVGSGFITVIVMCVAYSISDGIAFGFLSYTIMTLCAGKFKKSDIAVASCAAAFLAIYIVKYATGIAG